MNRPIQVAAEILDGAVDWLVMLSLGCGKWTFGFNILFRLSVTAGKIL
jgi:hypothetical protein